MPNPDEDAACENISYVCTCPYQTIMKIKEYLVSPIGLGDKENSYYFKLICTCTKCEDTHTHAIPL